MRQGGRTVSVLVMRRQWNAVQVDGVVGVLLLGGCLGTLATLHRDRSPVAAAACCVLLGAAVAFRRRMPKLTAVAALAGLVGYELLTHDRIGAFPPAAIVLCFYMVGRSGAANRYRIETLPVTTLALASCGVVATALHTSVLGAVGTWLMLAVAPLAVGVVLDWRSGMSARLAAAAAQLRAEQELHPSRAAAEERNRIARELHDVVAHCVSVMVVQAGAARLVAAQSPGSADEALVVIGRCGRDALADLRRIVGALRRDTDPDFGCGAGVVDLERLAARIRAAGVPTQLTVDAAVGLRPAVDAVAYRVVQEGLTNVVKHAGSGSSAHVRVTTSDAAVTVEVTNTPGAAAALPAGSGHGLVGMRERVSSYGGEVRAGRTHDGGYAVYAHIPIQSPNGRPGMTTAGLSELRVRRLWRRLPGRAGDALIAAGWLVAMEIETSTSNARHGPWAFNASVVAVMAFAAGWRRRNPLLFLMVVGGLAAALSSGLTSFDRSTVTGLYSLAVPMFTIAAWQVRSKAILGLALWVTGAIILASAHHAPLGAVAGASAMAVIVWTTGRVSRAQRALAAELTDTTAQLAAERDQRAELAVASERVRIARELHGLVAHRVVTMVVQSESARTLLAREPSAAEAAIRALERTGRDALTQLRRILGVLRSDEVAHTTVTLDPAWPSERRSAVPEQVPA